MIVWITAITDIVQIVVSIERIQQLLCHLALLPSSENATVLCQNIINSGRDKLGRNSIEILKIILKILLRF